MTGDQHQTFSFDDVQVEPRTSQVFKAGVPVQLEPKSFRLLMFLIENRDRLVEKEEILDAVWKDTNVTENALTRAVAKLRKVLGDDSKTARYIQTIHTRGYRFIAEIEVRNVSGTNGHRGPSVASPGTLEEDAPAPDEIEVVPTPSGAGTAETPRRSRWPRFTLMMAAATGLCLLLAGVAFLWHHDAGASRPGPGTSTTSVAVLPFKSGEPDGPEEYLGVEIADALTTKLAESTRLVITPITTVLHYAHQGADPLTIGRTLKVDYVLYGEIRRAANDVTMQLVRIRDGAPLLATTYTEKFADVFQLEESLCTKILSNLTVTLDHEATQRLRKRYTENLEAYEAFLKAHYFMNKSTGPDAYKAIEYFQQAIKLDPRYAMAYAGLADCYRRLGNYGVAPAEFVPKSRAAVMKALELDDTVAYAHSMLGMIAYQFDWDFPRANREYMRARELEPTLVHQWYASYLLALNRTAEAGTEYQKFSDFLPFLPGIGLAQYSYFLGQYDRAADLLHKKLEANPGYPPAHELLGLLYEQQGRTAEAIAEFQKCIDLSESNGLGSLGHLYAALGRKGEARKVLQKLNERSRQRYISPYARALIYVGLEEKDEALKYLEKAYEERSLSALNLRFDPRLNSLRTERRFKDFVRRLGLSS
jgi:DNA-binding winged helix-turn-helix (wHTH) protein/tetratricopeptide (TPR) repeat protein